MDTEPKPSCDIAPSATSTIISTASIVKPEQGHPSPSTCETQSPFGVTDSSTTTTNPTKASIPRQLPQDSPVQTGLEMAPSSRKHGEQPQAYLPSQGASLWNPSARPPSSDVEYDNYTLHNSPTTSVFSNQVVSAQSSPRSWGSPDQFRPVSWMPEQSSRPTALREFTSASREYGMGSPAFSASGAPPSYLPGQGVEPYSTHYHSSLGEVSAPTMSPANSSMGFRLDDDMSSTAPGSEVGDEYVPSQYPSEPTLQRQGTMTTSGQSSAAGSPSSGSCLAGHRKSDDLPYAQLIYKALMGTAPRYAMTLQEIYQWFRENTEKGKSDSKGWQNSIRHNLSMNRAFTKVDNKSGEDGDDADEAEVAYTTSSSSRSSNSAASENSKKSTEWFLEPWAIANGVESTTRYRKGNGSRRSGQAGRGGTPARGNSRDSYATGSYGSTRSAGARRAATSSVMTGRVTRAPVRGPGTLAVQTTAHYHHHLSHPQQHMGMPHGMVESPYSATWPATGYEASPYHYTDPQILAAQAASSGGRAPSESALDEPLTPEPYYPGSEPNLMLPDLRGAHSSSSSNGPYYHGGGGHPTGEELYHQQQHGAHHPHHHPHQNPVVGVYDPDRYSGGWSAVPMEEAGAYHSH